MALRCELVPLLLGSRSFKIALLRAVNLLRITELSSDFYGLAWRSAYARQMKKVLTVALLLLSLAGNVSLGLLLLGQENKIEAGLHAEVISEMGLRDLSFLLRKSGATPSQLLEWARSQPNQPGEERVGPELVNNRFVWFPLEVTFGPSGTIERLTVGQDAY